MKLWEVLKALEENPNDTYISEDAFLKVKTNGEYFEINGKVTACMSRNYEKVEKSVPWQEAAEAWASGKQIRLVMPEWEWIIHPDNEIQLNKRITKIGKWFIEGVK